MIGFETVLLVALLCVTFEAFFSGSEIAIVSASRERLRHRAAEGDRGARLVEGYLEHPQVLLATTLLGTNLATVTFSVTVALFLMTANFESSELLAVAMVTPMTLIFGEVIPKTMFQQHADALVTRLVYPLHFASLALRPAVWIMSGFAGMMMRLLRSDRERTFITRDELSLLLESDHMHEGDITDHEREMISNVLEMSEAEVVDVMMPLSEVTALPEETTVEEAAREVTDKQHSRMPIYRSRVDNVVGVLHVFDLLQAGVLGRERPIREIARSATFIPETKPAVDLLVELQGTGNQMAIVVDEYGGAVGIVTIEDLLEEIVGEIEDEHDEVPTAIVQERPGVWRVEARMSVERVNEELGLELPEGDDYETIAGLVLDHFKRIPRTGESVALPGLTVRVLRASDRAVEEVQILRSRRR